MKFTIKIQSNEYVANYISKKEDVIAFLSNIDSMPKKIAIDIETYGEDALIPKLSKIRTIQMYGGGEVYILDLKECAEKEVYPILQTFLTSKSLIAHNAIFETAQLQWKFYKYVDIKIKPLNIFCTQNLFRLVRAATVEEADLKASLKVVCKEVFHLELPKEEQGSDWGRDTLTVEQLEYCAKDAVLPYLIFNRMFDTLVQLGMKKVYALNTQVQEAVAHMRMHGFGFDVKAHTKLIEEWKKETERTELKCIEVLNTELVKHTPQDEIEQRFLEEVKEDKHELIFKLLKTFKGGTTLETIIEDKKLLEQKIELVEQSLDKFEFKTIKEGQEQVKQLKRSDLSKEEIAIKREELKHQINKFRTMNSAKLALKKVYSNIETFLINPKSTAQKAEYFSKKYKNYIEQLGLETSPKSGLLKVDNAALDKLSSVSIEAKALMEFKHYEKLLSTYGLGFKKFVHVSEGLDIGVVFPNHTLCKTFTGRMSSYAPNCQNLPSTKEIRALFIPKAKNRKMLCADFSQIELRVAAILSKDEVMLEAYRAGKDIHRITASNFLHVPEEEVTKEQRSIAKAINFGLIYGAGYKTLQRYAKQSYGIDMTLEEAEEAKESFIDTYETYRAWQMMVSNRAKTKLETRTPMGKKIVLSENNYYTRSMNYPVQGGAGEVMLYTLLYLWRAFNKTGVNAYICNVVHDEVIVDCLDEQVEVVKGYIKTCMEKAMLTVFPNASIKDLVEVGEGNNWGEAK